MKHKVFHSSDQNVSKFVFETEGVDNPIAVEAVLYKYGEFRERTVICCSTQCGCPVGCSFCGTGETFVRNLGCNEIEEQIKTIMDKYVDCSASEIKKFQIMFMSMGEPMLNWPSVEAAIVHLHDLYPNAELLISTSAPASMFNHLVDLIKISRSIPQVGIQFSVHEWHDEARAKLIPSKTSTLRQISCLGEMWAAYTGRRPFFNYCVHENNSSYTAAVALAQYFNPDVWEATLSVICEKSESVQNSIQRQLELIKEFEGYMTRQGFSLRVFNPAGQDDIGGGCGQLWYFQQWRDGRK